MPEFGEIDLPNIKGSPSRVIPITRPQETVALGLAFSQMKVEFTVPVEPVIKNDVKENSSVNDQNVTADVKCSSQKEYMATHYPELANLEYTPAEEFEYVIDENGSECCRIVGYNGTGTLVNIPPEIHKRKVVAVRLVKENRENINSDSISNIETIIIPETVHTIMRNAFWRCKNLKNIIASENITEIDSGAFWECKELQRFDFCNGLCEPFKICFPKGLKKISANAFEACMLTDNDLSKKTNREKLTSYSSHCFDHFEFTLSLNTEIDASSSSLYTFWLSDKIYFYEDEVDALSAMPYTPEADFEIEDYYDFEKHSYDGCRIAGYKGSSKVINIPPMIRGKKVRCIDLLTYRSSRWAVENVTTIIIPSSVKKISHVSGLEKLHTIVAHPNIESIGFQGLCLYRSTLKLLYFGYGRPSYKTVYFPDSLKEIGYRACCSGRGDKTICIFNNVFISRNTELEEEWEHEEGLIFKRKVIEKSPMFPVPCKVTYYD